MPGGLDHLVVVSRDLDAAATFYRRLGFQVGAQNRHDWGTLNRIVQFDGCFVELLTTEPGFQRPGRTTPVAQFVGPIVDYLDKREGLAMMVLEGLDAGADHAAFNVAGIGLPETFYFARQGRRPDGEPVEVAFSLAFANNPSTCDAGFFVCQQHAPELFWNPAYQDHGNGVRGISRVVFAAERPADHSTFFEAYTAVTDNPVAGGIRFELARGAVDVITPAACAEAFGRTALPDDLGEPRFAAIEFNVPDTAPVIAALIAGDVPFDRRGDTVVVPASAAMGVTLAFSENEKP